MRTDNLVVLNELQIEAIKRLVLDTRRHWGVDPNIPIGSDIRLLLEKHDIFLCEYPYPDTEGTHTYGNITWFKINEETLTFIGLNTSSYYDEQIFAIAHEMYHYSTRTGKAYSTDMEYEDSIVEKKADRFAAELLLPDVALKNAVSDAFHVMNLYSVSEKRILRFIARIQCDWWLPYQAIVNRLYEEQLISDKQYKILYESDCRSIDGIYRKILKSTDEEISELLNKKTKTIGISNRIIEIIINNYEDGFIDDNEFSKILDLFGKKPENYGFDMEIEIDDDLQGMFESEVDE